MAEYTHKLKQNVDDELRKISEKGISSANLENAYKLAVMREKLCRTEQLEDEMEEKYSQRGYSNRGYSRDGYSGAYHSMDGYSGAMDDYSGKHYVRGHYSRDGYSGNDYSAGGRMENCKMEMMEALETMERTANGKDKQKIQEYKRIIGSMEV